MGSDNLTLSKVFNFEKWQQLQDSIAAVSKVAIITVDYKGNPVTSHSCCSRFCQKVREDENLSKYCKKCDSRGGLEAVRLNKPYIYLCHYNIVDIAIPIIVNGKYIAAIMGGQVRISDEDTIEDIEQIVSRRDKNKDDIIEEYYNELPVMTYKEVENIADMLFNLCNYLVDEALDKSLILEMYNKVAKEEINADLVSGYSVKSMETVKKKLTNVLIDAQLENKNYEEDKDIEICSILKPAIDYIYKHKAENISADKMASICHISPSYFSRLFLKETGEKFSTYLSKLKMKWAKGLLENTDMTITEISEELGFGESGYFIKVFKKYEGVTPAAYRKYCKV